MSLAKKEKEKKYSQVKILPAKFQLGKYFYNRTINSRKQKVHNANPGGILIAENAARILYKGRVSKLGIYNKQEVQETRKMI